jgi:hypothetical protein
MQISDRRDFQLLLNLLALAFLNYLSFKALKRAFVKLAHWTIIFYCPCFKTLFGVYDLDYGKAESFLLDLWQNTKGHFEKKLPIQAGNTSFLTWIL